MSTVYLADGVALAVALGALDLVACLNEAAHQSGYHANCKDGCLNKRRNGLLRQAVSG